MSNFLAATTQKARTQHVCCTCFRAITKGEEYLRQRSFDGLGAFVFKQCDHCRAVAKNWDLTDDQGVINEDCFIEWSDYPGDTISELRAIAGWRNKWRTQSGQLWPVPAA